MGYGVAMPKRYYKHMSAEEHETLSLGLALGHSLRTQLAEGCSPEQIAGRLTRIHPDGMGIQHSAETLYVGLYVLFGCNRRF